MNRKKQLQSLFTILFFGVFFAFELV